MKVSVNKDSVISRSFLFVREQTANLPIMTDGQTVRICIEEFDLVAIVAGFYNQNTKRQIE